MVFSCRFRQIHTHIWINLIQQTLDEIPRISVHVLEQLLPMSDVFLCSCIWVSMTHDMQFNFFQIHGCDVRTRFGTHRNISLSLRSSGVAPYSDTNAIIVYAIIRTSGHSTPHIQYIFNLRLTLEYPQIIPALNIPSFISLTTLNRSS